MVAMLQAISASEATPLVRVSWNAPGEIMKALDAGAQGVICPMINSRAECEAFIKAARYPPLGQRSFGPIRAALISGPGYAEESNGQIVAFAMIETAEALAAADEICATPGLDGIYVGPSDLAFSLGLPPAQDSQEPTILAAFDTIIAACRKAGIKAAVHTSSVAYSQAMIARGFDLVRRRRHALADGRPPRGDADARTPGRQGGLNGLSGQDFTVAGAANRVPFRRFVHDRPCPWGPRHVRTAQAEEERIPRDPHPVPDQAGLHGPLP
jgi:4-hydroxy-2-oxoheptanedioate aldolase